MGLGNGGGLGGGVGLFGGVGLGAGIGLGVGSGLAGFGVGGLFGFAGLGAGTGLIGFGLGLIGFLCAGFFLLGAGFAIGLIGLFLLSGDCLPGTIGRVEIGCGSFPCLLVIMQVSSSPKPTHRVRANSPSPSLARAIEAMPASNLRLRLLLLSAESDPPIFAKDAPISILKDN